MRVRVPLRWVDQDAQGHVNNALIADYLQEARVALLLSGDNAHLLGSSAIVVGHQVEFLRPVEASTEPAEVEVLVGAVGAATVDLGYEVHHAGHRVARARTRLAIVRDGRPRRMTADEREWFTARQRSLEPLRELGRWEVGERAHVHPFWVRWSDLDAYRHVNNVRYFDYVAEARIRMNPGDDGRTRMEEAAREGLLWMVVRQDVAYHSEITHRLDPYQVRTAYAAVGRTSITLVAQIEDPADGQVHARATTVLVHADAAGNPAPVPEETALGPQRWPAVTVG